YLATSGGWRLRPPAYQLKPDTSMGEAPEIPRYEKSRGPGSTAEVDFWTSRDVREVIHSHLNYVVADTKKREQAAAHIIDKHEKVDAFAKNAGLGFAIPYIHNGQLHDYMPDFIIRLKGEGEVRPSNTLEARERTSGTLNLSFNILTQPYNLERYQS
ncbi:MAG: hypothetical protein AAB332_07910, partial [Planctomycetota bacterium]